MQGARTGKMNRLRRLVAGAMARDLCAFAVPGADVARAQGLDLAGAGLHLAATPRHANLLLIVGPLPSGLADAATVAYAQMPRPRAIIALGTGAFGNLPEPDVSAPLTQTGLIRALAEIRRMIATGAFAPEVADFTAPALQTRIEYTCPMHPEVVSSEPGNCPKCGMTLMPKETAATGHSGHAMQGEDAAMPAPKPAAAMPASHDHDHSAHAATEAPAQYTCPMHPEVLSNEPGSCPKCGMFLVPVEEKPKGHGGQHDHDHSAHAATEAPAQYTCPMHPEVLGTEPGSCPKCGMFLVPVEEEPKGHGGQHDHGHSAHAATEAPAQYTCPMHPEVLSTEPGSCPKCGMFLVPVEEEPKGHGGQHDHGDHATGDTIDGIEPQFMSMVELTRGMPASADGLIMEWIEVPFGPLFPGLPSGLDLTLTLDGDAVADSRVQSLVGGAIAVDGMTPEAFVDHVATLAPLSPVANRQLACLALENAAGTAPDESTAMARAAAVERERIASHLGWLAGFAAQNGLVWMERRAAALQVSVQAATADQISAIAASLHRFLQRSRKTPMLRARLSGIGRIDAGKPVLGPVARAQGIATDARAGDPAYQALGFEILTRTGGDALARFYQRCDEISQSLGLIARAGNISVPVPGSVAAASGHGEASVETPRGATRLKIELRDGKLVSATCQTASAAHMELLADLIHTQEIADALVTTASLDLSPWGLPV